MSPSARRRLVAVPSAEGLVDSWLAAPWDPFDDEGRVHPAISTFVHEDFPEARLNDRKLPIGIFTIAYLALDPDGAKSHIRRGLRALCSFHLELPLDELTEMKVKRDKDTIRDLARERLEERIEWAEREPDEFRRQQRLAALEVSRERDGLSQWEEYLSAIRNLRLFAESAGVRREELPRDPTKRLHRSVDRVSRTMLEEEDLNQVWRAIRTRTDPDLARLVVNFVRETAARRGAVINLNLGDIDWAESTATLLTKGGTTPEVVVSGDTLAEIALRAIEQGWDGKVDARAKRIPAFATSDGQRITRRWFDGLHRHIQRETGEELKEPFTVHWLRHTTISQVERIAGLNVAAQWAGHRVGGHGSARGNATSIYVRWTLEERKALFARMFPKTPPRAVDPEVLAEVYREMNAPPNVPQG